MADLVFLEETKCQDSNFGKSMKDIIEYASKDPWAWVANCSDPKKGYSGTATGFRIGSNEIDNVDVQSIKLNVSVPENSQDPNSEGRIQLVRVNYRKKSRNLLHILEFIFGRPKVTPGAP